MINPGVKHYGSGRLRWRTLWALLPLVAVAAAMAGCGGDSSSDGGTNGGGEDTETADAQVQKLYDGLETPPPTSGPSAQKGKNVWVISCGQAAESCVGPTEYELEAGELLGWKMTVFDGKFDPNQYTAGIRQAIAAGADGIITISVDCPLIRGALKSAKQAGVEVVGNLSVDCNEVDAGSSLYSYVPLLKQYPSVLDTVRAFGAAKATWAIAETGGNVRAIDFRATGFPSFEAVLEGFENELNKCEGCSVVETVNYTPTDYGAKLQQKVQQALVKHPEANVLVSNYDSDVTGGIAPGVAASGRTGDVLVLGGEGRPENLELMRDGQQSMAVAWDQEWLSFAVADALNRLFAGEKPVPQGVGWYVADEDHNLPSSGDSFPSKVDFKAAYEKLWQQGE